MKEYLDIVRQILNNGEWKENRTGVRTLTCPNVVFSHNMSDGFSLLSTKRMPLKTVAVELEGFIKGITSKKRFQDRNCHIWDEWANPTEIDRKIQLKDCYTTQFEKSLLKLHSPEYKKQVQKEEDDLGPIYGYQWRRFNAVCDEDDNGCLETYDQLKTIVDMLKTNPNDRRMVCSAWNPVQMNRMALPPCHFAWNLVHINGVLNLCWIQRSCDLMLGVPFNIASYALLLLLLCKESGMKPGNLTGVLVDCHIYENHLDAAKTQLERRTYPLPSVEIPDIITLDDKTEQPFSIFNWTHKNFTLNDYTYWPTIKMDIAV